MKALFAFCPANGSARNTWWGRKIVLGGLPPAQTVEDKYPLPNMADLTSCLDSYTISQGSIFRSENDIYPPPLLKIIFFLLSLHVIFRLPSWPFCLNSTLFCNYFTLLLPLSHFLSPFFLFLLHFPPFSLRLFIFFPPNDIGWYFPPPRGGRVFSNI